MLAQDDLYNEEFISNRDVLQSLLEVLLTSEDKEAIAVAAAQKVRLSVLSQLLVLSPPVCQLLNKK